MSHRIGVIAAITGAAFFGAIAANVVSAQQSKPELATSLDRAAIEQIVRDTIRDDPAIIVEALNLYSANHLKDSVRARLPELLSEESGYVAGKNIGAAKVAVIEFFDYHCGFCKRSVGYVQELIKGDPSVKVALRELPILREESEVASRYALASRNQGKYQDFHFAMLGESGVLTEKRILEIAKELGMDIDRLKSDSKKPALSEIINADRAAARDMGIDGTPTFIVASLDGDFIEVIPGYRPDAVTDAIAQAKKRKK